MNTGSATVQKWLTPGEKLEYFIEEKRFFGIGRHRILALTSDRAIIFIRCFGGRLRDETDKLWRQLIDVHLNEGFFSSSLTLEFFHYHDSIIYHDPHNPDKTELEKSELTRLPKRQARVVYACLKEKEKIWKERRRVEQLEHDKALGGKYFHIEGRSAPPTTESNETSD